MLDPLDPALLLLHEDVGENYDVMARSAAAAVGAEACHLALYDAETEELIARRASYLSASRSVPQYRFPIARAPASQRVVLTGEPYLTNDPGHDPLYDPSAAERGVRSVLTVPVRRGNRILGLLYALNKPGGFLPEDMDTLTALAGAAAVTLENIRRYAEERERRILSEGLREVSRALIGSLSEDAALGTVLDQMWKVVRYQAALAAVVEGPRLRVAASRGGDPDVEIPLDSAGELREALRTRQTALLGDAAAQLPRLGLRGVAGKALAAPLLTRDEVRGAVVVVFEPEHLPGLRDGQIVSAFADHAALFLEAGSLLRRERQARARAAAVARITRLTASRHEPDSLLQAVAPELLPLTGSDRAILYLKHPRSGVLAPVAWAGIAPEEEERVRDLRLDLLDGLLQPLRRGEAVLFQDEASPPPGTLNAFPSALSLVLVPLVSRDEILGAAAVVSTRRWQHFDRSAVDFLSDISQQIALGVENARLFAALSQMASTDELTRLANRRRFSETLRAEMGRARRTALPLSLVLADVDHLKRINDAHGHPTGDAAIRHVADALRDGRRETDMVARLGGEEFALLLPATDHAGAIHAAERIRRRLSGSAIPPMGIVTVSLGVATAPGDAADEETLVRVADQRLYVAKESGRNRVCAAEGPVPPATVTARRPAAE